jgi:bifunctional polynucleotide phosphatase/kinase
MSPRCRTDQKSQDSTLISTASGNTFARDSKDWKWWHQKVPDRIRQLNDEGCVFLFMLSPRKLTLYHSRYQVIVLSNQKRISLQNEIKGGRSESKSLSNFKEKALAVMQQLDVPMSIYAATHYDGYRKPRTGMWNEFLDDYDLDVGEGVDLHGSFFVGDAAGRPGDHSCVDR